MVEFLSRTCEAQGSIEASVHWYPACSFLPDTALSLVQTMQRCPAGIYHLDGNPGLHFHEIAVRLNNLQGGRWVVHPGTAPIRNSRMVDQRMQVSPITRRFHPQPMNAEPASSTHVHGHAVRPPRARGRPRRGRG